MLKRIISRLDVKNGVLVKGINLEGLRNLGDPNYFAKKYYDDLIDEIHFQDIVASLYNRNALTNIVEKNSKSIFVNVCVGGGIRSLKDVDKLLRIGVDKIAINSEGVKNPNFLKELVKIYGSSTISVNIEAIKTSNFYEVMIETGREKTGINLFKWIDKLQQIGVGEIIITKINDEGKQNGFDVAFYESLRKKIDIPLIAHGGAGSKENILKLFKESNVDGVSIASIFHYKYMKKDTSGNTMGTNYFLKSFSEATSSGIFIKDLKNYLVDNNVDIRI